ncbi:hypothetical protein Pmani_017823 [Petrolisthes manimaculis]|uniref:Uncharacterized protein n=1 Tax=Petrolisthes manimaculis TaxID=1843537 RepID=A0AAE1PLD8_9EUCA|nr:hypothetical protein Pmani_017823 [Petrolisthes manimaculis]
MVLRLVCPHLRKPRGHTGIGSKSELLSTSTECLRQAQQMIGQSINTNNFPRAQLVCNNDIRLYSGPQALLCRKR